MPDWNFCPVVLQLAWLFIISACFTHVHHLAACQPWVPITSLYYFAKTWAFLHTFSHIILTWFPPKYRLLIELQTWHGIKPTKWLIKSNLTTGEEEWRRSDGRDMVSENGKHVCRNGDCKETSRKFPSSKTNPRFLGPIWLVSLSNVVWVFLIYMWVKKCVEICEKLFKMWKCWLELTNQTGSYLFTIMPQVKT